MVNGEQVTTYTQPYGVINFGPWTKSWWMTHPYALPQKHCSSTQGSSSFFIYNLIIGSTIASKATLRLGMVKDEEEDIFYD